MNTDKLYPIGRALAGLLFVVSGVNKILAFSYVAGWMASSGLPAASVLLVLTILLEVGGGLALITGFQARIAAAALALFLVPVTLTFHGFWHADAAEFQNQLNHFFKNVAILGGMLVLFAAEQQRFVAARKDGGALLRGRTA